MAVCQVGPLLPWTAMAGAKFKGGVLLVVRHRIGNKGGCGGTSQSPSQCEGDIFPVQPACMPPLLGFQPGRLLPPCRCAASLPGLRLWGGTASAEVSCRPPSWACPPGEQVAQAQGVGQLQQGHHVLRAGPYPDIPPAPQRVGVGPDAAGDLRPRQPRLPAGTAPGAPGSRRGTGRLFCCSQSAVAASGRSSKDTFRHSLRRECVPGDPLVGPTRPAR